MKIFKLDFIICALFLALFKIFIIPTPLQQTLKIISIVAVLVYLLNRINRKELLNISLWWVIIIVFTSFLGYFRNTISLGSSLDSILHGMCIYSLYTLIAYCSRSGNIKRFINILFCVLILYSLASLVTIIIFGGGDGTSIYYFAGNKFRTCYYFIFLLCIVQIKYYSLLNSKLRYKLCYVLLSISVIILAKYIQCSTAMVAMCFVTVSVFIPNQIQKILKKPTIVLISLGIAAVLLLVTNIISESYYINYVVTELLGEDIGLTGRFRIYSYLFSVVQKSWLFGYGYGNYAVGSVVGYGNAQNSVIQLLIDYGIIGVLGFFILVAYCFKRGRTFEYKWGYYVYIYTMLICSMIEICFNYNFYTMLFLICLEQNGDTLKYISEKHQLNYKRFSSN